MQPPRSSSWLAHLCACDPCLLSRFRHAPAVAALLQPWSCTSRLPNLAKTNHCPACRCSPARPAAGHEVLRAPRQHSATRLEHTGGARWCADCKGCCSGGRPMSWCRCLLVRSLAGLSVRVAPCVQAARLAATASWNPRSRGTEHARACRAGGSRSLASAARRARTPQAKRVRGRRQAGGVPRYTRSVATPLSAAAADGAAAGAAGAAAPPRPAWPGPPAAGQAQARPWQAAERSLTRALRLRCRQRCHSACVRVAGVGLRAGAICRCAWRCGSVAAAYMQPRRPAGPRPPGARVTPLVGARRLTRSAPPAPPAPQDCPQPRDAEAVRAAQQAFWDARRARGGGGAAGTGTPKRCGAPALLRVTQPRAPCTLRGLAAQGARAPWPASPLASRCAPALAL